MRVNVYKEEITDRVEIIPTEAEGAEYTGVRFYLYMPVTVDGKQVQGPFLHRPAKAGRPADDDSSAVTFFSDRETLKKLFRRALEELEKTG